MLRHIFARPNFLVQNSPFYIMTTTLDNATIRIPVCHIKEVVTAKILLIYVMYI